MADKGGAHVLAGDLIVIFNKASVHDDLQGFEAGAVVEFHEAEIFHIADGAGPAAHRHALTLIGFRRGEKLRYFGSVHIATPNQKTDYN